jgi:hypothetical protein
MVNKRMKANTVIFFILIFIISACTNNSKNIPSVTIPVKATSSKTDTSFTVDNKNYKVGITQSYTNETVPSNKTIMGHSGRSYRASYRDLNFDISISENNIVKFTKSHLTKSDFSKDLSKNVLDSGIMKPIVFQYVPENGLFVFYSKVEIPGSTSSGVGIVVNQDFKANYIVTK